MFVDPGLLHAGGNQSHRAAGHAQEAADQLSRGLLLSEMFGEFPAADHSHDAVRVAHEKHVQTLRVHQDALINIGSMDKRNAAKLRAVRCNSNT
ncbi:hypothetical protein A5647_24840 [Mycobacterium sp. 1100029.7]|nr:hypothetical protein A5647_24840 [Mycobacterium sp. 1100029.7]